MSLPACPKTTTGVMEVAGQVTSIQLDSSVSNKRRRRVDSAEPTPLPKSSISNDPLPTQCCLSRPHSPKNSVSPTTTFEFPDQIPPTTFCLKIQSATNRSTLSDLKADENCGAHEISASPSNGFSSDEIKEEIVESPTIKKKRKISQASSVDAAKMPSTEEIEEFFSVAEKLEMKRFMEKYNYDIVKDMALEGRYQWVCLEP